MGSKSMTRRRRSKQEMAEERQKAENDMTELSKDTQQGDDREDGRHKQNGGNGVSASVAKMDDDELEEQDLDDGDEFDESEIYKEHDDGVHAPYDVDNVPEPASARAERKLSELMSEFEERLQYQIGGKHWVHIYRDKPHEDRWGNTISGFTHRTQEPRIDLDWLRNKFGGGVYHVCVWGPGTNKKGRRMGKKLASVYALEIAGEPKVTLADAHFQEEEGTRRYEKTKAKIEAERRRRNQAEAESVHERHDSDDDEEDEDDEGRSSHRRRRGDDRSAWTQHRPAPDPMRDRFMAEYIERSREDRERTRELEDEIRRSQGMGRDEYTELLHQVNAGSQAAIDQMRSMIESFAEAQKDRGGESEHVKMLVDVLRDRDAQPPNDSEAKRLEGLLQIEKDSRKDLVDRHATELDRRDKQHADEFARRDKVHENELKEIRDELSAARREAETARGDGLESATKLVAEKEASFRSEKERLLEGHTIEKEKLLDQISRAKDEADKRERDLRERAERDLQAERQRTRDEKERAERDLQAERDRNDRELLAERRRTQDEKERADRDIKDQQQRYEDRIETLKDQHAAFVKTAEKGHEGIAEAFKQQVKQLEAKVDELRKDLDNRRDELNAERLRVVETKQEVATAKLEGQMQVSEAKAKASDIGGFSTTLEKVKGLGNLLGLKSPSEIETPSPEKEGVGAVIGKGLDAVREGLQTKEVRDLFGAAAERMAKANESAPDQPPPGMPPQVQPGGQPLYQQAWHAAQQELAANRAQQQPQQPQQPPAMPQPAPRPQVSAGPQQPPQAPAQGMSDEELEMFAEALAAEDAREAAAVEAAQRAQQVPPIDQPVAVVADVVAEPVAPNPAPVETAPQENVGMIEAQALQQLIDQIEDMAEDGVPVEQATGVILAQFGFSETEARLLLGNQSPQQIMDLIGVQPGMVSLAGQEYFEEALNRLRAT